MPTLTQLNLMSYKLKLDFAGGSCLTELSQRNPLRWKMMYREGDVLSAQSPWLKCKDYFNDVVAYVNTGVEFEVHGFKNKIKLNEEGLYVVVNNITDKATFINNMAVVNEQLYKDIGDTVSITATEDSKQLVLLLPRNAFQSTYVISLLTYVIRNSNYGYKYKSWDSFWEDSATTVQFEADPLGDARDHVRKWGFAVPEQFKGYWWYAGKNYNGQPGVEFKGNEQGYNIHNNGMVSFRRGMAMAGWVG